MTNLTEARRKLFNSIGEETKKKYILLLRKWFRQNENMTKIDFNRAVFKILQTQELFDMHDRYMLSFYQSTPDRVVSTKLRFEVAQVEQNDSFQHVNSTSKLPPNNYDKFASREYVLPDKNFILSQLEYHLWEWAMNSAEDKVSDLMVVACQIFVKNILSAMITKKTSYKVKKGTFQYNYNFPAPNPFLRNSNNVMDYTQEDRIDFNESDEDISTYSQPTLERAEQQAVFAYACGEHNAKDDKLSVDLLFETLLENPTIVGIHSINSPNLVKIHLLADEEDF